MVLFTISRTALVINVQVRVTRWALVGHRYNYSPHRYRTSQDRRTFIPLSVSLWNNLAFSVFKGVGLAGFGQFFFIGVSCSLPFRLLQFFLVSCSLPFRDSTVFPCIFCLWFGIDGLGSSDWYGVNRSLPEVHFRYILIIIIIIIIFVTRNFQFSKHHGILSLCTCSRICPFLVKNMQLYPKWPHRQGGLPRVLKVARSNLRWGYTDLYYARGAQGVLPMRVRGATSQLDQPSLTSLFVAGCGRLQLGVP